MNEDAAEIVAIKALEFLAQDMDRMGRFLALTGSGPGDLRAQIKDPAFLGGVLDYFLNFEPDLISFCEWAEIDPSLPAKARRLLPGASMEG